MAQAEQPQTGWVVEYLDVGSGSWVPFWKYDNQHEAEGAAGLQMMRRPHLKWRSRYEDLARERSKQLAAERAAMPLFADQLEDE